MKVGIEIKTINYNFYLRRCELGMSQIRLRDFSRVDIGFISAVENLKMPAGRFKTIKNKLNRLASALTCDFDWLFPSDYLDAIQGKLFPRRNSRVVWVRDISLITLRGFTTDSIEAVDYNIDHQLLGAAISNVLTTLGEDQRNVIRMRFGIGCDPMTLREVGEILRISTERVRQIESMSLAKLRHPIRSSQLRFYLG